MALIYAHRGASGYAPENTFAAFDLGLDMRADGIETDIRATRDDVLVLLHDVTVDRTTNGAGPVADLTWEELQRLDAGIRFGASFAGQRVPRLDDLLDRYAGRTRFWLEIKAPGVEAAVAEQVQARKLASDVQISCFDFAVLRRLHEIWPEANMAFLTRDLSEQALADCRSIGVSAVSLHTSRISDQAIARVRKAGIDIRLWGVEDRATLVRIEALGVAGLTLNWPDWATERG